ncbi:MULTISPECIES: histidine phosphatase family protein [unclassified Streptococcus]|uniref:histidine phosphatase family protein n=1 Tax=unclassified Streptococcus TaxID=2608887 RepID=UPI001072DF7D|nr:MULTISPECIES: histidine phosphatase family protein [unclassified Streptococcus]MBF0806330.1 histidine phosphatase family protein [Streptococcus sp. 19428wA2_WM07]TFU28054.1 histidine phosphatase family protein [Streptococcus sp. WM07]
MKLYFVRHGRTEWNEEGRFQGASGDSPLLDQSIEDIETLGKHLQHIHFDRIFSSDLPRALHTARIIQAQNLHPVKIEPQESLREWQLGRLEGQKIATMEAIYPQQIRAFRHNLAKFNYDMFEAESVYKTTQRVAELVHSLKNQPYEHVLFVGHGANLVASLRTLLGVSPAFIRDWGGLANGSLTILETDNFNDFQLLSWNDTSFLESVKVESIHS